MTEKQLKLRRLGMEASYLAACALHNVAPEEGRCSDPESLYQFCKFHSITSIVAMALEEVWKHAPTDVEIMTKWRQARDKAIRKNILLNAERERILAYLESIGCLYLPLKGSLMQFEYPRFGMRQMNDNDILIDESRSREIHEFMIADGYEAESFLQGNHDEYVKKPLYVIEMHRRLFMNAVNPEMAAYYDQIFDKLIPDGKSRYGYKMRSEDFYIFMVAHAYKHYLHGGIGIRNLLDVYVYTRNHGNSMDWDYIRCELMKFGAWSFDEECRKLSEKLFAAPVFDPSLTDDERCALDIYFFSGAFGTEERVVENRLKAASDSEGSQTGKMRYILRRLFPPVAYLAENAPILRKKPWLAPFFYVKRFCSILFGRRSKVFRELKNLIQIKK